MRGMVLIPRFPLSSVSELSLHFLSKPAGWQLVLQGLFRTHSQVSPML